MKNLGKLAAIEKQLSKADNGGGECTAYYKVGRGGIDGESLTIAQAFEAALRGDLVSIEFPISHDERMLLLHQVGNEIKLKMHECSEEIYTDPEKLIMSTKPVVFLKQQDSRKHGCSGYFEFEDGRELHYSQARKYAEENNCLLICPNYDPKKEKWYQTLHEKKG